MDLSSPPRKRTALTSGRHHQDDRRHQWSHQPRQHQVTAAAGKRQLQSAVDLVTGESLPDNISRCWTPLQKKKTKRGYQTKVSQLGRHILICNFFKELIDFMLLELNMFVHNVCK